MKRMLLVVATVLLLMLTACSGKPEPQIGEYATKEGANYVFLSSDNKFNVVSGVRSYSPAGTYEISDGKIILTVDSENKFIFSFENNTLILESGDWLESVVEKGTEFYLTDKSE